MRPVPYKGFAIEVRTFQVRGTGRWTLDLLIGRIGKGRSLRAFTGPDTFPTEQAAIAACWDFGRKIIDGKVRDYSVDDLA